MILVTSLIESTNGWFRV